MPRICNLFEISRTHLNSERSVQFLKQNDVLTYSDLGGLSDKKKNDVKIHVNFHKRFGSLT